MMALWLLLACGDKNENDTQIVAGDPPDVTGHYNVILGGVTGCKSDETWIKGWANGPLVISGEPDALVFDFGDGVAFDGQVGATADYNFFGVIEYNKATLSVANGGDFTFDDAEGRWEMNGSFEVEVDTDPEFEKDNCTMNGPVQAYQLD